MDRDIRQSRRHGDELRAAHLLRRAGRTGEAADAFAAVWRAGGPAGEEARGCLDDLLADPAPAQRLSLAPHLDALAADAFPGAAERLYRWFPAVRDVVGWSAPTRALRAFLYAQARADGPVVLWGEPGVGRALAARTLHALSERAGFHEAYAPQSAARLARDVEDHTAPGGTLYVSYVDAAEADRWLGFVRETCAARDARLVIGANRDPAGSPLPQEAAAQRIAPLRERFEDLPLLVAALLEWAGAGEAAAALDAQVYAMLAWHDWPGNVRELANHVGRAVLNANEVEPIPELLVQGLFGLPGEVAEHLA